MPNEFVPTNVPPHIVRQFPKVPIVGQKQPESTCHYVAAQAVVTCKCGDPAPIVIPALDRAGLCKVCKTRYVIAKFNWKNDNGLLSLDTQIGEWKGAMNASEDLSVPLKKV